MAERHRNTNERLTQSGDRMGCRVLKCLIWLLAASAMHAQSYTISTIAGGGPPPSLVPALEVSLPVSGGIAVNNAGEVYFPSGNTVLKVDAKGILTRLAGTGRFGSSGDGGPATSAPLAWPAGLAADASGNVYIAENAGHRIRRVSPDGTIATVAGTGNPGDSGDGGPAIKAQLNYPSGVAVDTSGNLYIADTGNKRIRKVSAEGVMTTAATGIQHAEGVAVDASGNVYITGYVLGEPPCAEDCDAPYIGRIVRVTSTGVVDTIAGGGSWITNYETGDQDENGPATKAILQTPRGIAVDAAGTLYISDTENNRVRKFSPGGAITTAAGVNSGAFACTFNSINVRERPLSCPVGVTLDASGNLYIADTGNHRIRKVSPQGNTANIAGNGAAGVYWGDGGPAQDASLFYPFGVAVDRFSNLYIADAGNSRVRKVSPDGVITTVAGNGSSGYSGDGGPATSAQLKAPAGVAVDASGNLYIADLSDHRIRKVSASGIITTVAGNGVTGYGFGPWGDCGPATSASLAGPRGVAVDARGNLYIADTWHYSIRKVSPDGIITTVAGKLPQTQDPCRLAGGGTELILPTGVAVNGFGDLYIADYSGILKFSSNGIAGIVLRNEFGSESTGVAVDAESNIFIAGRRMRKIAADGTVSIVAGNGTRGYSGDGGPALDASFAGAAGIAVNGAGDVYVADAENHVVRVLRVKTE